MKIYIGPYKPWITSKIHTKYMTKKYGSAFGLNHNLFELCLEKFENFLQTIYNCTINSINHRIGRKIKIRIDKYDTWSMNTTLARIIVPMLKQLKAAGGGFPCVKYSDIPYSVRKKKHKKTDSGFDYDYWQYIMTEMIFAFEYELFQNDPPEDNIPKEFEFSPENNERADNGFLLFGKYFSGLWD